MGMTLKEYIKAMLGLYRGYPDMPRILAEIYKEWYGSSLYEAVKEADTADSCDIGGGSCFT